MYVVAFFFNFNWRIITLQYCGGFCHTFTWISHGYTCVPLPEPSSHLPPHPIPQGHPSAPALSTLSHALNLDWRSISHMIIYMFQCYSLKSSHPRLLPQSRSDGWVRVLRAGAPGWPWGMRWGGWWEGSSGWGTHVHPWLIHVNVWQNPPQYCKVISLRLKF